MCAYYIMHNDDMQVCRNRMNLAHNRHHYYTRSLPSYLEGMHNDYLAFDNDAHTSRRDYTYKTRC